MRAVEGRGRVVGIVLFLLLVGSFLPAPLARAESDIVPVPDVTGKSFDDARAALAAQGLLVATIDVAGTPPGTVARQTPGAGASLPVGGAVILEVRRKDATPTKAPNAVGLTTAEASAAFGSLYVLEFTPRAGASSERGKVVAQSPKMGAAIDLRGTLTLTFVPDEGLAPRVAVPDAAGLSSAEAIQAMAAAGLHARVAQATVPGAPADLAIGQSPLPGTEADRYDTVDVIVTTDAPAPAGPAGPTQVLVPGCVGLTEASARAALTDVGLGTTVEWVDGDPSEAFLVRSQDPATGTSVDPGTSVALRIVRYAPAPSPPPDAPAKVGVPYLIGMSAAQAQSVLASLGLLPNPLFVVNPSVPPLRVFAQQILEGTWVDAGTWVTFRVSAPTPPAYPVPVPNFYGRTKWEAMLLAATAGLVLDTLYVADLTKPVHRVFSQSVAAWAVVPVGTHVTVWIATHPGGPPTVAVPNLFGKSAGQAMALLAAAGLSGDAHEVWAPGKPPLKVYDQNPNAGVTVLAGSTVSFQVAKLFALLSPVPDVTGKTKAAAHAILSAAGFVSSPVEVVAPGKPVGLVYLQSPSAGLLRPPGTVVHVKVAKGPAFFVVAPDLVGLTKAQALAALAAVGLGASPSEVFAFGKPIGKVFDQSPNAGISVPAGSTIAFQVAKPPFAIVTVPNLHGKIASEAQGALAALGLGAAPQEVFAPGHPLGRVFSQDPPWGTHVVPGTTVSYKIARTLLVALRTVPSLLGRTKAEALAALAAAGLVGSPSPQVCLVCPAGRVNSQDTPGGTLVAAGTVISFTVATGLVTPLYTTVPHLKGHTKLQAEALLASRDLGSDGTIDFKFGEPLHRVWHQSIAAGTVVPKGTVVKWRANP